MKNRFVFGNQKKRAAIVRGLLLPVAVFAAILLLFFWGIQGVESTTRAERLRSARQAVTKAAVQCYVLEGAYPKDVEYLERNYGLAVDRNRYIVHYGYIGSNLMPQIQVMNKDLSE